MTLQSHAIHFFGFWREANLATMPAQAGIFCVYAGTHHVSDKTISVRKLIYIGEADNVCSRIARHEHKKEWLRHTKHGETLCFSFAPVASYRAQYTTALVFKHRPPENVEHLCSFPFEQTSMRLTGQTDLLLTEFSIVENSLQMFTKRFIQSVRARMPLAQSAEQGINHRHSRRHRAA